jgi:hypothetical protein
MRRALSSVLTWDPALESYVCSNAPSCAARGIAFAANAALLAVNGAWAEES